MTNKQLTIIIGVLVLNGVLLASLFYFKPATQTVVERPAGAVAGPRINSEFFEHNGVTTWSYKVPFQSTGSTTCSYRVTATSSVTMMSASANRLASSTVMEIGTDTTAFATSTVLVRTKAGTGGADLVATTSASTNLLVTPGTFINVKIGGGDTAGTVTPLGDCNFQGVLLR